MVRKARVTTETKNGAAATGWTHQFIYSRLVLVLAVSLVAATVFLVTLFTLLMPYAAAVLSTPYYLEFEGGDYNNKDEVTILMNGETVAVLPNLESLQSNQGGAHRSIDVTSFLVEGVNTLTFLQNIGSSQIRDLVLVGGNVPGMLGAADEGRCLWQPNHPSVTYKFLYSEGVAAHYRVEWEGYDFDTRDEVTVTVNGQVVDSRPGCNREDLSDGWVYLFQNISPFIVNGTNTLTFTDNTGSSKIGSLVIDRVVIDRLNDHIVEETRTIFSDPGVRSLTQTNPSTTYTFQSNPPPNTYTIEWEGYDYDSKLETTIILNGQVIANLPSTWTPMNNDVWRSFSLTVSANYAGDNNSNTLIFTQNIGSSKIRNLVIKDSNGNIVFSAAEQRSIWLPSKPSTTYSFNLP